MVWQPCREGQKCPSPSAAREHLAKHSDFPFWCVGDKVSGTLECCWCWGQWLYRRGLLLHNNFFFNGSPGLALTAQLFQGEERSHDAMELFPFPKSLFLRRNSFWPSCFFCLMIRDKTIWNYLLPWWSGSCLNVYSGSSDCWESPSLAGTVCIKCASSKGVIPGFHCCMLISFCLGHHTPSAGGPFSALTPSIWPQEILAKYTEVWCGAGSGCSLTLHRSKGTLAISGNLWKATGKRRERCTLPPVVWLWMLVCYLNFMFNFMAASWLLQEDLAEHKETCVNYCPAVL